MTHFILKCVGYPDGTAGDLPVGSYLRWFTTTDAEGLGHVDFTDVPLEAKRFESQERAIKFVRQVHSRMPVRPYDGKANRPLTACNWEVIEIPTDAASVADGGRRFEWLPSGRETIH